MTARAAGVLVAAVLAGTSCRRCGESPAPAVDAGVAAVPERPEPVARPGLPAADLRQGVLLTVPEFRGVSGLYAVALVERRYAGTLPPGTRLGEALAPGIAGRGWTPKQAEGKPLVGESPPFFLEAEEAGGHPVLRAGIVVPGEKVVDLLQTPAPLGSQALALRLPPLPGAGGYEEHFTFETHYRARPDASERLLRQLATGLQGAGWTARPGSPLTLDAAAPDAGPLDAGLPETLDEALDGPNAGTVTLHREGERVTVTWEQPLTTGRR